MDLYDSNNKKIGSFYLPSGQISVIPAPIVQATVGLIQNTDITLRGIPSVNLSNNIGSVSMIGGGLKHNVMRDFAGKTAADLIPFDLSIALGYTRLNYTRTLNAGPDNGAQPINSSQSTDFSNQRLIGHFNGYTAQAIISKKIALVTPFLAVGYQASYTDVRLAGNYPVTTNATLGQQYYETFSNPVYINETSTNGLRADVGFQLELGFFRIYGSYSQAQYKSVNAGIGFGL